LLILRFISNGIDFSFFFHHRLSMLKYRLHRLLILSLLAFVASFSYGQVAPALSPVLVNERAGSMAESARGWLVVDSRNQPHLVVNDIPVAGFHFDYFARINGSWQVQRLGSGAALGGGFLMRPSAAYDPVTDRLWVAGWRVGNGSGEARVWQFQNASTGPARVNASPYTFRQGSIWGGQVHFDPRHPGQIILSQQDGFWRRINASAQTLETGQIFPGANIEKQNFAISAVGDEVVYHAISGGHQPEPSGYQNSARVAARQGRVVYADFFPYSDQRWDYYHPGLGVDRANARIAYFAWTSDARSDSTNFSRTTPKNLYINVYNGSGLVRPANNGLLVDSVMGNHDMGGTSRAPIQFAPAPGGGTWMIYVTPNRKARLVFITQAGGLFEPFTNQADPRLVADGALWANVATDEKGDVHVAWGDGVSIFYSFYSSGPATEPVDIPGWGPMNKVIGENRYLSPQFGELVFGANGTDFTWAFAASLGVNIIHQGGGVYYAAETGVLIPTADPGYITSQFFGRIHFGQDRNSYGGAVFSDRFGWMIFQRNGNNENLLWVAALQAFLKVNTDGSFENPALGFMRPIPGNLNRYETGAGVIDVIGVSENSVRAFAFPIGSFIDISGDRVVSEDLGALTPTGTPRWFISERFGLVHVGRSTEEYNRFVFTQRFGWIRFETNQAGRFFWSPRQQSWFTVLADGNFYGFDIGPMVRIPGSFTDYNTFLGVVTIDDQNPQGWVRSQTLGFIWPLRGSNAVWFFSERRNDFIGVMPDGRLWSTRDNRFL
jgi:hypothetical protein